MKKFLILPLFGISLITASRLCAATVINNGDSGAGSRRQTVLDAAPGDTITCNAGEWTWTIQLNITNNKQFQFGYYSKIF